MSATKKHAAKILSTLCILSTSLFAGHALAERAVVSKEAPSFPSEALDEGVNAGLVKVKLTVDGNGAVTNTEIVDAQPKKIFDKSVRRAVSNWKFAATGATDVIETTLRFQSK